MIFPSLRPLAEIPASTTAQQALYQLLQRKVSDPTAEFADEFPMPEGGLFMKGKLLDCCFLPRGSIQWGRMGFTINATDGLPVLGVLSHRRASREGSPQ